MSECAHRLGLDAGQIDEPHAAVHGRPLREQPLAAVNDHVMAAFCESWRQLDEEGLGTAIGRRDSPAAADSEAKLTTINRMPAGRVCHGNVDFPASNGRGVAPRVIVAWRAQ